MNEVKKGEPGTLVVTVNKIVGKKCIPSCL
jgi:hypothetical protein